MITAIVMIVTLALLSAIATRLFISQTRSSLDHNLSHQALLLAESGMEKAKYELTLNPAYLGEVNTVFGSGTFTIAILTTDFNGLALPAGQLRVSSTGSLTTAGGELILRTVEEILSLGNQSGWAVGRNGEILRWSGAQWSAITSPFAGDINDVTCNAADDCWFVGVGGNIARWNGATISTPVSITVNNLNAVACDPNNASQCFAVGDNGTIMAWNGSTWNTAVSGTTQHLNGIHCPDAKCYTVGNSGTIRAYTGSWISESTGTRDFFDVHCWSTNNCLTVGEKNGSKYYLQRRSGSWADESQSFTPSRPLNAVACLAGATKCWALSDNGKALRKDGVSPWVINSLSTSSAMNDIWCSQTSDECWATGRPGGGGTTLLHWLPATGWVNTPSTAGPIQLFAIHFAPGPAPAGSMTSLAWRETIP
jgi:hypothetical protein